MHPQVAMEERKPSEASSIDQSKWLSDQEEANQVASGSQELLRTTVLKEFVQTPT